MNRSHRPLALVSCALLLALKATSAQGPQRPTPQATTATSPPAAGVSYVFEQKRVTVRFDADGTGRRELTLKVRVATDMGVREWAAIPLPYASASEDLELKTLEVHKRDGTVVPVAPDAVPDMAIQPSPQLATFLDVRQKQIAVPALQPGDTIMLSAIWTVTKPLVPNHFWFSYSFTKDAVVNEELLEIDAPAAMAHVIKTREGAPAEAGGGDGTVRADRRVYRWRTSNTTIPPKDAEEPDEPPVDDVRLTTFKDWSQLAWWFYPRMNVPPDAIIRAKATELTKGLSDRRERIEALYEYVATQIRYVSLSFGIGRLVPHAPADVLKHQYGDCKDKHALLAALLSAAGIEAFPVLINSLRDISDDFASPGEINHAFTAISGGGNANDWIYVDTTAGIAPFRVLSPNIRNKRALIAGGGAVAPQLITTPADPPFPMVDRIDIDGAVDGIGVLRAKVRIALRGDSELVTRAIVRGTPGESLKEFVEQFTKTIDLSGDVSDVTTTDPSSTRVPFEMTFQLRQQYLNWAAAAGTLEPVSPAFRSPGADEPLKKDVKRGTPIRMQLRSVVELPDGYEAQAPVGVTLNRQGISYTSAYRIAGRNIVVERSLDITTRTLSASHSAELASLGRAIDADSAQKISVKRTGSGVPAIPADATARELRAAGYSAYETKLYDAALVFWKRTVELDPKMSDGWNSLAFAYLRLGKHADAVASLEKQIALNAFDKRAYSDLGYVHDEAGNYEAAAKAYEKHLQLNPLDRDALRRAGYVYAELERASDAVTALDKAVSLEDKDGWVHVILGESYLELNQPDKARRAFDRALEILNTPAVWTRIAHELATHDTDTKRVFELASRMTKYALDETSRLTLDSVADTHLDLMDWIAWTWAAQGISHLKEGQADAALRYVRSAWRLEGSGIIADQLGQVHEKRGNLADALNFYFIAQALLDKPSDDLLNRVKRLAGGGDLEKMLATARSDYETERSVYIDVKQWQPGTADYLVLLENGSHPVDVKMLTGDERLRPLAGELLKATFPLEIPDGSPVRLVVKVRLRCSVGVCRGSILRPSTVKTVN